MRISWSPRIQLSNERKQNKNDIAKFSSHHWKGEQKLMITDQQNYKLNDMPQLTSIDYNNVATSTKKKVNMSSKLHQISAKDIVNANLIGNASCQGVELINTTFQHKSKHKEASANDKINHTIVDNSNAYDGNVTIITNNDKGGKKIVASEKIIDEEIAKDTKNNTIKQNTVRTPISVAKAPNVLETRAEEKENTISCLFKTIETSKEDFNKQILEKREGTSRLRVTLKTEIDLRTKIKIWFKENQDKVTLLHKSGVMSKGIEEGRERMI